MPSRAPEVTLDEFFAGRESESRALFEAVRDDVAVSSAILAVRQSLTDQATRPTRPAVTSG